MALFRYLTFEGGLATLKNGTLKLTPPREFNDPFDMYPAWKVEPTDEMIAQLYREDNQGLQMSFEEFRAAALSNPNAYRDAAQNEVFNGINMDFGAVCFSHRRDSVPMWGYYCSQQTGLVIEFDETRHHFREKFGTSLRDVHYVFARQSFTEMGSTDFSIFYTKSLDWGHEAEVRLIHPLKDTRVTKGVIGAQPAWFLAYPRDSVTAIYFGCRMSAESKRTIATGLSDWGFNDVKLIEMHPHPENFAFDEHAYDNPDSKSAHYLPNAGQDVQR